MGSMVLWHITVLLSLMNHMHCCWQCGSSYCTLALHQAIHWVLLYLIKCWWGSISINAWEVVNFHPFQRRELHGVNHNHLKHINSCSLNLIRLWNWITSVTAGLLFLYRLCKYGPAQFFDAHFIESVPICRMALIFWIPRLRNAIYRLRKSTKRVKHNYNYIIIIIIIIIIVNPYSYNGFHWQIPYCNWLCYVSFGGFCLDHSMANRQFTK